MLAEAILSSLPADIHWVVMFRLRPLRNMVDDATILRMFYLPQGTRLEELSHVVLTSHGRAVVSATAVEFVDRRGPEFDTVRAEPLVRSCADLLSCLPEAEPDCIGLGQLPGYGPTVLHVVVNGMNGDATAVYDEEPDTTQYDLLRAIGVQYAGGKFVHNNKKYFVAKYVNDLSLHIRSGQDAGFSRTANCNFFFLKHGVLDDNLLAGLKSARHARIQRALVQIESLCARLVYTATKRELSLVCEPLGDGQSFSYGDLVPLGIGVFGLAMSTSPQHKLIAKRASAYLDDRSSNGLWPFHSGRLVTATDTVLTMLGRQSERTTRELERFASPKGGYLPQIAAEEAAPEVMLAGSANKHWRQADFVTTCLVHARQESTGRDATAKWILERIETRSGLFIANPYFVDLAAILALVQSEASDVVDHVCCEILASQNNDASFGGFDRMLSTSLACLALAEAGYVSEPLLRAQLWLAVESEQLAETTICTPFYSTFLQDGSEVRTGCQYVRIGETMHELSLYRDRFRMIETAFLTRALSINSSGMPGSCRGRAEPHPRYGCSSVEDYVMRFALPPYLDCPGNTE